jgi:hypothetical protein
MKPVDGLLSPFSMKQKVKHNYTVVDPNDDIVCMFGIVPDGKRGIIWLLGSNLVDIYQREFIKNNRKMLNMMQEDFPHVGNYISLENKKSIKWLRWLGFEFSSKKTLVKGTELVYFYRSYNLDKTD